MKLHNNQQKLIQHLIRFQMLDYQSCLDFLDYDKTGDNIALSYAFRPLTKYGYLHKHKDGTVKITAKGKQLFLEITPLISAGGGEKEQLRIKQVSRVAMLMERNGVPSFASIQETDEPYFIPSACWRKIAPGILSTTRFTGMLMMEKKRLAVYDIGDGHMEWQIRAEGSLFYTRYGSYETCATGMVFICNSKGRNGIAQNIIRHTMWNRRQLLADTCFERNRPVQWSRSPIKIKAQYEHVYLMTPKDMQECLRFIRLEDWQIERQRRNAPLLHNPVLGDYEDWPYRYFANPASDLLKFVYFFSAAKEHLKDLNSPEPYKSQLRYAICIQKKDDSIFRMYPEIAGMEGLRYFVYTI